MKWFSCTTYFSNYISSKTNVPHCFLNARTALQTYERKMKAPNNKKYQDTNHSFIRGCYGPERQVISYYTIY